MASGIEEKIGDGEMNKFILIAGVSLLCISCSVGPDYQRPQLYQDKKISDNLHLKADSTRKINPQWYKTFNDKGLNKLIDMGLQQSPDIKTALEKMHQARYRLYINQAGFLPDFDGSGTYTKNNQTLMGAFPIKSEYYQVGIDASWELDIWGGQRRLTENAEAMLRAAAADFDNVKISLISEIASQYINWRLTEKQLAITEKNLELQTEIFETIESLHNAGLADDLTYQQAKSVLSTTKMRLPQLKIAENSYKNALAVLTGSLPSDIVKPEQNLLDKELDFDLNQLYDLPVDIIRNRPDVQVAEQQLIAQNALIGQAMAQLLPSVSLSGFLGYQNTSLSPIFGPDYNMYNVGAAVNLPLLHWGELINQVNIQKSVTKQSLALYQSSILTAISDVGKAMKSVEEEHSRLKLAAESKTSNTEILELSMQKYQNGLIDFSDVLTSEQSKLASDLEYLQSNANVYLNVVSFYKAVGGGLGINHNTPACQTDATTSACVLYKD